jgi:hypothetical protein
MSWADKHGIAARIPLGDDKPERLPLILCGPILRRSEPGSVTVWVALKEPRTVTLRVYSHAPPPAPESLKEEMRGTRRTARLGQNLHVVAVTAEPVNADHPLTPGTIYFYNLFFSVSEDTPVPETADQLNSPNIFALDGATSPDDLRPNGLSYSIEHKLPGFSLPPENLNKLRIIHGSCRQPQGIGRDAFPNLDEMISFDAPVADDRPHLLLLTGDQIYADDVSQILLFMLMEADPALLGWNERDGLPDVPADRKLELAPGKRKQLVRKTAAFTTEDPESHLLTLGEYCSMYLFTWSDVLWPVEFPPFDEVKNDKFKIVKYLEQRESLIEYRKAIPKVRRALANVPTYMMIDDHDVTDDWNRLRDWCEQVYKRPLGRRIVQNGLLSYAVFQAWGNTPDRFTPGQPGDDLLTAAGAWVAAQGVNPGVGQKIEKLVGIPGTLSAGGELSGLFFTESGGLSQLAVKDSLKWHYQIKGLNFEILVTDSRTQRGYTNDKFGPPAHMSAGALEEQIPLNNVDPDKLIMIVSTNNVLTIPSLHGEKVFGKKWIWAWWYIAFRITMDIVVPVLKFFGKIPKTNHYNPDVNESWEAQTQPFESLLSRLSRRVAVAGDGTRRSRILLIAGDVHWSWASRMQYWADNPLDAPASGAQPVEAVIAQLVSSPFKKEEAFAKAFHNWGYIPMTSSLPGSIRWFGWKERSQIGISPQDMGRMNDWVQMPDFMMGHTPPMLSLIDAPETAVIPKPDWRYRIDFTLGEKGRPEFKLNELGPPPDDDDPQKWFEFLAKSHKQHKDFAQEFGAGLELVGKNSLGELRLQWEGDTTLVGGIAAADKSLKVASPNVLPAAPLLIKVDDEIIKVGAVNLGSGECSDLVRGQHRTDAAAHANGAKVAVFKTATQTQWWTLPTETKLTRYTLSLSYDDPQFPKPKLPRETNP